MEVIFSLNTFLYFFLFLFFAFFPLEVKAYMGKNLFLILTGASEIAWVLTVIAAIKYFIGGWRKINFDYIKFLREDLKSKTTENKENHEK